MSRMRQALKNLEARFPVAAPAAPSAPSIKPLPPAPQALAATVPPATIFWSEPSNVQTQLHSYGGPLQALVDVYCANVVVQPIIAEQVRVVLAEPAVRPAQPTLDDYLHNRTTPRPETIEAPLPIHQAATPESAIAHTAPQATDADAPAWKLNSPRTQCTPLEQTVLRLLTDPRFSLSYGDLAERLEEDFTERGVTNFALAAIESWRGQAELALALAGMLAERGRGDVLLIDGGGPGSTLTFELGHSRAAGLAQWLAAPRNWSKWIQPTGLRNLYFMPAGGGDLAPDADWPQALAALKNTFRHVIIDAIEAPPARLQLLARAATATYLTVPLGLAETLPAQQALTRLRGYGARVLGCIAAQASGS
jgi:Mrp family chromosome partitioning ATPase